MQEELGAAPAADPDLDPLLREGLDIWGQLTGSPCSNSDCSLQDSITGNLPATQQTATQAPAAVITAASDRVDEAFRAAHSMQHHAAPRDQHTHRLSGPTTGVSLQQLLSFVQLVQQSSSSAALQLAPLPLGDFTMQHQQDELNRLARICSRNKQANMAYAAIGKPKAYRQPLIAVHANAQGQVQAAPGATQPSFRPMLQPAHAGVRNWRPAGELSCYPQNSRAVT